MLQNNNVQRCYTADPSKRWQYCSQVPQGNCSELIVMMLAMIMIMAIWQGCVLENYVYFFVWTKNIFSGLLSFTYIKYFQCFWTMNIFSGLFSGWPLSWRLFGWVAFYTWDLEQTEYTRSICPFGLNICLPVFGRHLGFCIFVVTYCFCQCHQ